MVKKRRISDAQVLLTTGLSKLQERRIEEHKAAVASTMAAIELAEMILNPDTSDKQIGKDILALDLERYGGERLSDISWWLDPNWTDLGDEQDVDYTLLGIPIDDDFPEASNYKWGSYFTEHSQDVIRFVEDRARWILPRLKEQLEELEE